LRASNFLLSLLSPVWRAKLCGSFADSSNGRLELQADEEATFQQLLHLGIGATATISGGLRGLVVVAMMADRYRMEAVLEAVEAELLRRLTVETCAEMLVTGAVSGLARVELESRRLALRRFEELSRTDGFLRLGEDTVASLLDSDELATSGEEAVFEAVIRWMRGGDAVAAAGLRGEGLLHRVRFPLMDREYLFETARAALPEAGPSLELRVLEALALKAYPPHRRPGAPLRHLEPAATRPRLASGVPWGPRAFAGERRLAVPEMARSLALCGGRAFCGLEKGAIRVWARGGLALERTLTGHTEIVRALTAWRGWVLGPLAGRGLAVDSVG
jgi:hypothetical protein